jgi:hypothetical protein
LLLAIEEEIDKAAADVTGYVYAREPAPAITYTVLLGNISWCVTTHL